MKMFLRVIKFCYSANQLSRRDWILVEKTVNPQIVRPRMGSNGMAKRSIFYQYLNPNGFNFAKDRNFHYICQQLAV